MTKRILLATFLALFLSTEANAARGLYISTSATCADIPSPTTDETYCIPTTGSNKGKLLRYTGASFAATGVSLTSDVSGTLPVANGGTGITSGTSGGIPAFTGSGTIASSSALTANLPVIGGGAGAAPSVGTRSGNTTAYVTTTGTQTSGNCVEIDANGNHVAASGACGISGSGYDTIQEEGSNLTARTKLNFIGSSITCADDAGNTRTNCTVSGGSAGALTLVETKTLTSDSTSTTFSGLDGNTDGVYLLVGRFQQKVGTGKTYLHPNNSSANQVGAVWDSNGVSGDSHIFLAFLNNGDWFNFAVVVHAKYDPNSQSFPRLVTGTGMRSDSGFTFARPTQVGGTWSDTSTNLTSIVILNDQTSGFANGSTFSLYKYSQS